MGRTEREREREKERKGEREKEKKEKEEKKREEKGERERERERERKKERVVLTHLGVFIDEHERVGDIDITEVNDREADPSLRAKAHRLKATPHHRHRWLRHFRFYFP